MLLANSGDTQTISHYWPLGLLVLLAFIGVILVNAFWKGDK